MRATVLKLNYTCGVSINPYRAVEFDSADNVVKQANAGTDKVIGVGPEFKVDPGEPCDVMHIGAAEIEYGGTVARGDLLAADANGRAVATTTANNRTIGVALTSGIVGDIGSCIVSLTNV